MDFENFESRMVGVKMDEIWEALVAYKILA